jgi:hypothetical protein
MRDQKRLRKRTTTIDDIADKNEIHKIDETSEIACPECGKEPCMFGRHKELLVAFDDAEHGNLV